MNGYLRIDLADNCNIRCIMCQAYNAISPSTMSFLNYDEFVISTRGYLGSWNTIQLGHVAESTVHPRFADFLTYIRSQTKSTIHIVTNGKLLGRYIPVINKIGNCVVQVSMDSIKKSTHEYIREGSRFDAVISQFAKLDRSRNKLLLSFTLMASNIDEYGDILDYCQSIDAQLATFPMILRDEYGIIPLRLIKESLWFNKSKLKQWLTTYYGQNVNGTVIGAASGNMLGSVDEITCLAHHGDLMINHRGSATLCGKKEVGNISKQSLSEIWNSEEANEFRSIVDTTRTPCQNCDYLLRCLRPSLTLIENHFSEHLLKQIDQDIRKQINFSSTISDVEAMNIFVAHICNKPNFGVFEIGTENGLHVGKRIEQNGNSAPSISAKSREQLYKNLRDEVIGSSPAEKKLSALCTRWKATRARILVYPAGSYTRHLLTREYLKNINIIGLGDTDKSLIGKSICGHTINGPDTIMNLNPDVVLISSPNYESEIYDMLRATLPNSVEIQRLYYH